MSGGGSSVRSHVATAAMPPPPPRAVPSKKPSPPAAPPAQAASKGLERARDTAPSEGEVRIDELPKALRERLAEHEANERRQIVALSSQLELVAVRRGEKRRRDAQSALSQFCAAIEKQAVKVQSELDAATATLPERRKAAVVAFKELKERADALWQAKAQVRVRERAEGRACTSISAVCDEQMLARDSSCALACEAVRSLVLMREQRTRASASGRAQQRLTVVGVGCVLACEQRDTVAVQSPRATEHVLAALESKRTAVGEVFERAQAACAAHPPTLAGSAHGRMRDHPRRTCVVRVWCVAVRSRRSRRSCSASSARPRRARTSTSGASSPRCSRSQRCSRS
jgi:predicted metal-binding protein